MTDWRSKAIAYGNMVHGCASALESAGYPVDAFQEGGAVKGVADAVNAISCDLSQARERIRELEQTVSDFAEDNKSAWRQNQALRRMLGHIETEALRRLYGDHGHFCGYRSLCQSIGYKARATLDRERNGE